jgi:hypothetical protein
VDFGRDYKFIGRIFPFRDRPDFPVRVVFFPVPLDTPSVPFANPFVLRNWDRLEQLPQTVLGTDQTYREPYTGPVPVRPPGRVCGTADEWLNGLLYTTYIAGGYRCDHCEVIFVATVTSVRCDDGSIEVMPNVDDVEVHINTSHTNNWLIVQEFSPSNIHEAAAVFAGITGQDAPYVEVRRSIGNLALQISPGVTEAETTVDLFDDMGGQRVSLVNDGSALLRDSMGVHSVQLAADGPNKFDTLGDFGVYTPGQTRFGSKVMIGSGLTPSVPSNRFAELSVMAPNLGVHVPFEAGYENAGVFNAAFSVFTSPGAGTLGVVQVNGGSTAAGYALAAGYAEPQGGLQIVRGLTATGANPMLSLEDAVAGRVFAIDAVGHLSSKDITTTAGPPGFALYKLRITDLNTGFSWFVPLYPAF